jgi:hypothetical protein
MHGSVGAASVGMVLSLLRSSLTCWLGSVLFIHIPPPATQLQMVLLSVLRSSNEVKQSLSLITQCIGLESSRRLAWPACLVCIEQLVSLQLRCYMVSCTSKSS